MPWDNVLLKDLYQTGRYNWNIEKVPMHLRDACAWVEAENTKASWEIVNKWFGYIVAGTAKFRIPDIYLNLGARWKTLDQRLANRIIQDIEDDILVERGRFNGMSPPGFPDMPEPAKMAMAQELLLCMKNEDEIIAEAEERAKTCHNFPPVSNKQYGTKRI